MREGDLLVLAEELDFALREAQLRVGDGRGHHTILTTWSDQGHDAHGPGLKTKGARRVSGGCSGGDDGGTGLGRAGGYKVARSWTPADRRDGRWRACGSAGQGAQKKCGAAPVAHLKQATTRACRCPPPPLLLLAMQPYASLPGCLFAASPLRARAASVRMQRASQPAVDTAGRPLHPRVSAHRTAPQPYTTRRYSSVASFCATNLRLPQATAPVQARNCVSVHTLSRIHHAQEQGRISLQREVK